MIYLEGIEEQFKIFLFSLGLGAILGFIYDVFKIIRYIFNLKKVSLFILDFLYVFLCAIISFLYMLIMNNAIIRLYILLAEAIGFLTYYFTFSKLTSSFCLFFKSKSEHLILSLKNAKLKLKSNFLSIKHFNALKFRLGAKKASENTK